jgi:hypothetical protein
LTRAALRTRAGVFPRHPLRIRSLGLPFLARLSAVLSAATLAVVAWSTLAAASDTEVRTFDITVGSDKIGSQRLAITKQGDGSVLVKNEADVKVSILWVKITYWVRGYEIYKGGALQRLASNCYDNGDQRSVEVTLEGNELHVKATGKERVSPAGVWTTSFWSLPPAGARSEAQRLLDVDSGREQRGKLRLVGPEQCAAGGTTVACAHYRVTGDEESDLWFDGSERLVRMERSKFTRRVVMQLTSITR